MVRDEHAQTQCGNDRPGTYTGQGMFREHRDDGSETDDDRNSHEEGGRRLGPQSYRCIPLRFDSTHHSLPGAERVAAARIDSVGLSVGQSGIAALSPPGS
jgi:hypothetical protein